MIEATEEQIREELKVKFDDGKRQGFALKDSHFENGVSLHSSQYYFAKRYFQNTKNCEKLAELMCTKLINSIELKKPTTFIGYRNYSALVLNRVIMQLNSKLYGRKYVKEHNYAILEKEDDTFTWQYLPELNEHLLIVLPITCTCTTFFKIRRFLQDYCANVRGRPNIDVRKDFINVFLILDNSLSDSNVVSGYNSRVKDSKSEISENSILSKLQSIYTPFNWNEIRLDRINISTREAEKRGEPPYTAHPLVRLYSELFLPENCPYCYPEGENQKEFPLIPTHDNYETPNLIFGFPNFRKTLNQRSFTDTFVLGEKSHYVQLRGNILVDGSIYSSFIRGNAFYKKNRECILEFFDTEIAKYFSSEKAKRTKDANHLSPGDSTVGKIVFITCENKHSSRFLEDISQENALKDRSVTILRFLPTNEFIDNFISLHGKLIVAPDTKVIYFEEVISAGKTFKLISNYIKHARAGNQTATPAGSLTTTEFPEERSTHGFDLALTLVDRMLPYTKVEIMKKLRSEKNPYPEDHLVAYFKLNAPILNASHMDDGSEARKKQLEKVIERSSLDSFKMTTGKRIVKRSPIQLPELYEKQIPEKALDYFPFGRLNGSSDRKRFDTYRPYFARERLDLLHLHVVHELNNVLSEPKYQVAGFLDAEPYKSQPGNFIEELISKVQGMLADHLTRYFIDPGLIDEYKDDVYKIPERNNDAENEIVQDIVVKSLSQPRFIYYQNIYRPTFHYCIGELENLISNLTDGRVGNFPTLRKIKFYLRRSVDLNSNFMISKKFINFVEGVSDVAYIEETIGERLEIGRIFDRGFQPQKPEDVEFKTATLNNIHYRIDEITSFFSTLHYYYKELLFKNPARSLRLEALINHPSLLPKALKNSKDPENKVEDLITNSYFHFSDILRTENVDPLIELVKLHKKNIFHLEEELADSTKKTSQADDQAEREETQSKVIQLENNIIDSETIYKNYFEQLRNDPIILNARKHLDRSLHRARIKEIKLSASHALATVGILERKRRSNYSKKGLNAELKEVLDSTMNILASEENGSEVNYVLFVDYRKNPIWSEGYSEFYSYVKNELENDPSEIRLSNDGLIFNLLNGLYGEQELAFDLEPEAEGKLEKEQTLIAGIKLDNGKYVSFRNDYFIKTENKVRQTTFARLYENDIFSSEKKVGIELLNDATMVLAIRLADFVSPRKKEEGYALEGRAVLLITSSAECNTANFLEFMSSEKIRLLLLIKNDLLAYLQRLVDSEVFLNHIDTREEASFRRGLRHGLLNYRKEQTDHIHKIEDYFKEHASNLNAHFRDNFDLIEIVEGAIGGQLDEEHIGDPLSEADLTNTGFESLVRLIFTSKRLGERHINFSEVTIFGSIPDALKIHPSLIKVVIPELIINMKKHCPREGDKDLSISFDASTSALQFSNLIRNTSKDKKSGKGLEMCNGILRKLNIKPTSIAEKNNVFSISLKVK